jgi:Ran GTPase-activating protein (RanGAP) involved in mRNA processing and transport
MMRKCLRNAFSWRRRSSEEHARFNQVDPLICNTGDPTEIRVYDLSVKDHRVLQNSPHVKTLNLSDNSIGDDRAIALATAFLDNLVLERVKLGGNCFGNAGCSAVATSLANRKCPIQTLSLPRNAIDNTGARAIAVSLETNVYLLELCLRSNCIGSVGAGCLAASLQRNDTLQSLDLSDNCIGNAGLEALSGALVHNQSLKLLFLGDNRFSAEGLKHLVELVKRKTTLFLLDVKAHLQGSSSEYRELEREISHYLVLNQCGRGVIRKEPGMLSLVLEHVNTKPDLLYGLLRDLPHSWIHQGHICQHTYSHDKKLTKTN